MASVFDPLMLFTELRQHALPHPAQAGVEAHVQLLQIGGRAGVHQRVDAVLQCRECAVRNRVKVRLSHRGDVVSEELGRVAAVRLSSSVGRTPVPNCESDFQHWDKAHAAWSVLTHRVFGGENGEYGSQLRGVGPERRGAVQAAIRGGAAAAGVTQQTAH